MKLVKIEYLFSDEKEELQKGQWRHGLVVQYDVADEIDTAYKFMEETEDSKALDNVLEKHFGIKDDDVVFYTLDIEGLSQSHDIIIKSIEEIK